MKKYLLMAVSFVLVAALAVVGTLAYLQFETPTDVNVMTVGNVKIAQHEYERVVDENGNWVSTGDVDKYGYTPDELQEYTQAKPLYPAVFADGQIKWDDRNNGTYQQSWAQVGAPGAVQLFDDSVKNVIDKFVFVENTGKTDAYVRSVFAFEQGGVTAERFDEIIGTNGDSTRWAWETVATDVVIDGCEYVLVSATYVGATSNPNGILAAGKVSYPSLLQVYLAPEATNEDVEALDGNGNGTYDILVISQAVQAKGFDDAATALDAAFGEITANNHPWVSGVDFPAVVYTAEEFKTAFAAGGNIVLADDIAVDNVTFSLPKGKSVVLDLNGYTISATANTTGNQELFNVKGEMTVKNGSLELTAENNQGWNAMATIFDVTAGGVLNIEGVTANVSGTDMNFVAHLNNWGEATLNVNNCDFTTTYCAVRVFNSGYDMNNVTIENTDFHNGRVFWVHNYTSEGKDDSTLNLDIYDNNNTSDSAKPIRFGFNDSVYYDLDGNLIG
ncbi:MAG: hypothetical protein IKK70_04650 [Clostridia bacterium]|nr:hypothetical protein [Clostridia bacterium]